MDAKAALAMVNRIYARLDARRPFLDLSQNYYRGRHNLQFATEEWRKSNAHRYKDFSDNWCAPVVDAEAERLEHIGVKIADNDAGAKALWNQWLLNELPSQSSQGFVSSLTSARSFVIVWGDKSTDEPLVTWEHPANVEIEYDWENPRLRTAALKTWVDESLEYATLYEPQFVWKFQRARFMVDNPRVSQANQAKERLSPEGGWVPREGLLEPWPLVNPMGAVPVVEIPNRPLLADDPISEIQGVMPMQNAVNLLWAYLFLAADYASMPARVVLHQGPPMTPILDSITGKEIGKKPVDLKDLQEKRLLYLSGENTAIDSWEAARLDVFTGVIEQSVGHIAAQTRTPPHYLVSNKGLSNLSGDALQAAEGGLVNKATEFQRDAAPALREVYRLIALAMGDKALAEQARLATIVWKNAGIRSEAQMADALLKKKQMGYPLEYLMEVDGIDPVDIDRILKMRDAELDQTLGFGVQQAVNDQMNGGSGVDSVGDSGSTSAAEGADPVSGATSGR